MTFDDQRRAGAAGGEDVLQGERVAHGLQHMHPVQMQAVHRRVHRGGAVDRRHRRGGGGGELVGLRG